jgi:hypothetical protein
MLAGNTQVCGGLCSEEDKPNSAKKCRSQYSADDQDQEDAGPGFGLSRLCCCFYDRALLPCNHVLVLPQIVWRVSVPT